MQTGRGIDRACSPLSRILSRPLLLPTRTLTDNQWTLKMYGRRRASRAKPAGSFLNRLTRDRGVNGQLSLVCVVTFFK